jgi:peptidoglycan/xylan/chitin deacetylase (PgdA/CDA1 family)
MPADWRRTRFVTVSAGLHLAAAAALIVQPGWWPWLLLGVAGNHAAAAALVLWPQNQALGPALVRLPPDAAARGEVALTFDDGPDPEVTPQVLALLTAAGAGASFFCIGKRAARHPSLVQAIAEAGHSVENHTLTHNLGFAFLGPNGLRREIDGAQRVLAAAAGRPPRFFRAPMGFRGPLLDRVLGRAGLRAVCWTRRGCDTLPRKPASVLRGLLRDLAAGDVLMLHDGNAARMPDGTPLVLAVLPELLAAIRARGLTAVSLAAACAPATSEYAAARTPPAVYAST